MNSDRKVLQVKLYEQNCCKKCIYFTKSCDFDPDIPKCIHIDRFDQNDVYFICLDLF